MVGREARLRRRRTVRGRHDVHGVEAGAVGLGDPRRGLEGAPAGGREIDAGHHCPEWTGERVTNDQDVRRHAADAARSERAEADVGSRLAVGAQHQQPGRVLLERVADGRETAAGEDLERYAAGPGQRGHGGCPSRIRIRDPLAQHLAQCDAGR